MNMEKLGQIQLPAPEDTDPYPRLLLNGRGIHAGDLGNEPKARGPGCWYISNPGFTHICPIGLFVKE